MKTRLPSSPLDVRKAFALRASALSRTAAAVDLTIANIRHRLMGSLLPQAAELRELLDLPLMAHALESYIDETREFDADPVSLSNLAGGALTLTSFEDALLRLDEGIAWASHHSGFNWWLRHRQAELGLESFVVIPRAGSSRDFGLEPSPTLETRLRELQTVHQWSLGEDRLAAFGRLRLLTVPHADGASPRWHPISLGHELAHIRYTKEWVHKWLIAQTSRAHAAKEASHTAKADPHTTFPGSSLRWFNDLKSWLAETACDAVMVYFYGPEGIAALDYYLGVHSNAGDTETHPSPILRLAALRAKDPGGLTAHRSNSINQSEKLRRNAYCDLAFALRETVTNELATATQRSHSIDAEARDGIRDLALSSIKDTLPPRSEDWSDEIIRLSPSTIEAALVAAEWLTILDRGTDLYKHNQLNLSRLENRIDQAVNFLQFAHRFSVVSQSLEGRVDTNSIPPLTNLLHLGTNGISHTTDGERASAFDVRLGRHFIVFRRNQITSLHSLRGGEEARKMQELVEVGWGDDFVLHPGEMVLGVTLESLSMDGDCIAQVLSRSSLGRLGLLSATAVHVQPGFKGCLTLELVNLASVPLSLTPGQRVAQIVPLKARGESIEYTGKYQDQDWRPKFSAIQEDSEFSILGRLRDE